MKFVLNIFLFVFVFFFSIDSLADESNNNKLKLAISNCHNYIIEENFQEAINTCSKVIKKNSEHLLAGGAYYYLGYVYEKLDMNKEAAAAYTQAEIQAAIHPEVDMKFSYGLTKRFLDAFFKSKEAVKTNPNDASAHYELGLAYIMSNKRDKALEEYRILKELDKDKAEELLQFYKKTEKTNNHSSPNQ